MPPSRDPDRGDPETPRPDPLAGSVMTAGIVIAALGGVVLVIAAALSRSVFPGLLGAVALVSALVVGRWRKRAATTRDHRDAAGPTG